MRHPCRAALSLGVRCHLRTQVEFRSSAFPSQPGEDELINPGRWGKALADYLREHLDAAGLRGGEPYAEDWGWAVPIDNPEFPLFVGCGNLDDDPEGFLCFIEPSTPTIRKLFRKIDVTQRVTEVSDALDSALRKNASVSEINWIDSQNGGT